MKGLCCAELGASGMLTKQSTAYILGLKLPTLSIFVTHGHVPEGHLHTMQREHWAQAILFLPPPSPLPLGPFTVHTSAYSKHMVWCSFIKYRNWKWEYIWYLSFWDWLDSVTMIISSYIHFPENHLTSFSEAENIPLAYIFHTFFIHSCSTSVTWLGGLWADTGVVWLDHTGGLFLGFHIDFHSCSTTLHSHQHKAFLLLTSSPAFVIICLLKIYYFYFPSVPSLRNPFRFFFFFDTFKPPFFSQCPTVLLRI